MEEELRHRGELEHLVADLSTGLTTVSHDHVDEEIERAIREVGLFEKVDRAYVFQFSPDGETFSNTYEWCADGVDPAIDELQALPLDPPTTHQPQTVGDGQMFGEMALMGLSPNGRRLRTAGMRNCVCLLARVLVYVHVCSSMCFAMYCEGLSMPLYAIACVCLLVCGDCKTWVGLQFISSPFQFKCPRTVFRCTVQPLATSATPALCPRCQCRHPGHRCAHGRH